MEEFKNKNRKLKSVIILLVVIAVVLGGVYYFMNGKDISIPENNFKNQVENVVNKVKGNTPTKENEVKEEKELDPDTIVNEADKLDQEEDKFDQMIDDLGDLNI